MDFWPWFGVWILNRFLFHPRICVFANSPAQQYKLIEISRGTWDDNRSCWYWWWIEVVLRWDNIEEQLILTRKLCKNKVWSCVSCRFLTSLAWEYSMVRRKFLWVKTIFSDCSSCSRLSLRKIKFSLSSALTISRQQFIISKTNIYRENCRK